MDNMHLVTGYSGREHITAVDQAAFNAALIGTGQFVLDKGKVFEAQVISNNLVRVFDGELMMQGRFIRMNPDTYVDLTIENGAQGMKRNDLIVVRYTKDTVTGVEAVNLIVIKGTAVASNPVDPAHTEGDTTNGSAVLHDYPLWRIPLDSLTVGEPVCLFGDAFMDSMRTLPDIRQQVLNIKAEVSKQLSEQDAEMDEKISGIESYLKHETLSNKTKTLYGLDASALPDDVFRYLKEHASPKIGDIKYTIRTDLNDDWALCNGDLYDPTAYPKLAEIQPDVESLLGETKVIYTADKSSSQITSFVEANGYQVMVVLYKDADDYYHIYIVYSEDWFKTANSYELATDGSRTPSSYSSKIYDGGVIRYIHGKWVCVYRLCGSDSYDFPVLCYTDDISNTVWHEGLNNRVYGYIKAIKDVWGDESGAVHIAGIAGSSKNSSTYSVGLILSSYAVDNPTDQWTYKAAYDNYQSPPYDFLRANGLHIFITSGSSTYDLTVDSIVYAADITKTWTTVNFTKLTGFNDNNGSSQHRRYLFYIDGLFILLGYITKDSVYAPALAWTSDITNPNWNIVYKDDMLSSSNKPLTKVVKARDVYIGFFGDQFGETRASGNKVLLMPSLTDVQTWKECDIPSISDSNNYEYEVGYGTDNGVVTTKNAIYAFAYRGYSSTSNDGASVVQYPLYCLPKLSKNNYYAYMKVKGD